MKKIIDLISLIILVGLTNVSLAATYYVNPGQSIQDAIDSATDGDTIILALGSYKGEGNRDIDFHGKAIIVRSTDPEDPDVVAATIVDCEGSDTDPHRGFAFRSGEDTESVISGLTITNGYGPEEDPGGFIWSVGGAIFCDGASPLIINCVITGNFSAGRGGGIFCAQYSNPTIVGCTISGNTGNDFGGGGVYNSGNCSLTLTSCVINGNSAGVAGGGILCSNNCKLTLINCSINGNSADVHGGGIYSSNSELILTNCTINRNSALFHMGGGIEGGDSLTLTNCTISGNTTSRNGGGILWFGNATIANCTISDNDAGDGGGGIYCNGTVEISNCTISGNSAGYDGLGGGGITCRGDTATIINCRIMGNYSYDAGGGVYCLSDTATIINCIISGNETERNGGGIYCFDNSSTISNCIISGNQAGSRGDSGGGVYGGDRIVNCTINENSVSGDAYRGGGLSDCTGPIVNCIFWENSAQEDPQLYNCDTPTYSCIQDWTGGGEGNINTDPMFINSLEDFYLRYTIKPHEIPDFNPATFERSPCIDAGDSSVVTELFDLDGNPRIQGITVDMGCYECPGDTDIDGMADSWEVANFGSSIAVSDDDPDTDGLINIGEFVKGFDPMNEFNVLTMIRKDGDNATILWNSVPTHQYMLWKSSDLVSWTLSSDWQVGTGLWIYQPKSMLGLDKMFYKIEYKSVP